MVAFYVTGDNFTFKMPLLQEAYLDPVHIFAKIVKIAYFTRDRVAAQLNNIALTGAPCGI